MEDALKVVVPAYKSQAHQIQVRRGKPVFNEDNPAIFNQPNLPFETKTK